MEKKIIIFLLLFVGFCISCSSKSDPKFKLAKSVQKVVQDTIFFETDKLWLRDLFPHPGVTKFDQGLLITSTGKGKSIWVDSVFYGVRYDSTFFAIVSSLDFGCSLLYHNGDSLRIESAGFKHPIINEFTGNKNKVVCVTDNAYASGYLNKTILCYKLDANGLMKDKQAFFPKKEDINGEYDFDITFSRKGNKFYILKNGISIVNYNL